MKQLQFNFLCRKYLFLLFILPVIFIQCDNNKDELDRLNLELSLEQVKIRLLQAKDSVNLISAVNPRNGHTVVLFESGDSLLIPSNFILSTETDPVQWKIIFNFRDQTSLVSHMLGELLLTSNNITVNPFARCPLCALAKIETPVKGRFKIIVHGKGENGISLGKEFERYSDYHEIPILGLYPNYRNNVEFIFLSEDGLERTKKTLEIETPSIPENPTMNVVTDLYNQPHQQLYFSSNKSVGFDQRGEIRWYYKPFGDFLYLFPKLKNGNLVIVGSIGAYSYHASHFFEITPLGQIIKEYNVPNHLHHEIVEMPSGNFLVLSNSHPIAFADGVTEEDTIIEIDRTTGNINNTWDFNDILDPTRPPIPSSRPDDWLHTNALEFDENDNSIIVSGRSQSAIIKIDYTTSQIKWILGNHNNWKPEFQNHLLTAVDASGNPVNTSLIDFWPAGQHSPRIGPNGNLIVYDNGDSREFYDNNPPGLSYSRMVEYHIDDLNKKISIVRDFSYNKSLYTKYTGTVSYDQDLATVLIGYMYTSEVLLNPKIVEVDNENSIVFEADFSPDMANYRALKIDLYKGVKY